MIVAGVPEAQRGARAPAVIRAPPVHARSRIRGFALLRPTRLEDATAALLDGARAMAGGIDLVNAMKCGEEVDSVVYLRGVAELRRIRSTSEFLELGAAVTHAEIERNADVAAAIPDLAEIIRAIANIRVRIAGTIGGNLMCAHRYYDWLPILAALDAEFSFITADGPKSLGAREVTADDGFWNLPVGLLATIQIPLAGRPSLRFVRRLKPILSIAACRRTLASGAEIAVAVGCMHTAPIIAFASINDGPMAELGRAIAGGLPDAHDDGYASGGYRTALAATLISRTIAEMEPRDG
jgi:carbon-monoxide dehydrogenase medium subunit